MVQSTLKVKYNSDTGKVQSTLGWWVDELKVKVQGSKKDGSKVQDDVLLALEKPGHFILEHHLQKKDTRLQFHSHADILSKTLKLTFVHHYGPGVTTLEGSTAFNRHNKLTVKHNFAKSGPVVKYEVNKNGFALEPQFDFGAGKDNAWGVSLKKGLGKQYLKATYFHHKEEAELELQRMTGSGGPLKITAVVDVKNPNATPKLTFEKEWKVLGPSKPAPKPSTVVVVQPVVVVPVPKAVAPPPPPPPPPSSKEWFDQEPWSQIKKTIDEFVSKVLPPKAP